MKLADDAARILRHLLEADGASFATLVSIAGLDPRRDFRGANLSGVLFEGSDVTGYDFSDADLTDASFVGAFGSDVIFDRATIDGVHWPSNGALRSVRNAPRQASLLRPRQEEIVAALFGAFKRRHARALAVIPPGIGKTAILAELLRRLASLKDYRAAVILCASLVERDQVIDLLKQQNIPIEDGQTVRDRGKIRRGMTLVMTVGAYHVLRDDDLPATERFLALKMSHIVLFSLPTGPSAKETARLIAEAEPAILGFGEFGIDESNAKKWLSRVGLDGKFDVAYQYGFKQAVEDGILIQSEVIDRRHVARAIYDRDLEKFALSKSVTEEIASDFRMEYDLRDAAPALVLVPSVEAAERLAEHLSNLFDRFFEGDDRKLDVLVMSARSERRSLAAVRGRDVVVVATATFVQTMNLGVFRLIGVLARVPEPLMARLLFPSTARAAADLRVLDYVGSIADEAARRPG